MKSEGLVRLGRAVVAQRKRLGWATREAFEDNIDLTYRVLTDLENGNRKLGAKAYGQVERALRWEPGSIDDILAGVGRWHVHRPNGSDSLTAAALRAATLHALMTSWR